MRLIRLTAVIVAMACSVASAVSFVVASESGSPSDTTHTKSSGAVTLGISDIGGGYINYLYIPNKGDVMGSVSDMYGRGGQSAIRDYRHGEYYNPTQAGFTDQAGTRCPIGVNASSLEVQSRPCSLFNGDGVFDFTRWENLVSDGYSSDGGNSDDDTLYEESLSGQQAKEITSEFDYYGAYTDMRLSTGTYFAGNDMICIPCFRHYFEYTYRRDYSWCMAQHVHGPYYDSSVTVSDISTVNPSGTHPAYARDMGVLKARWDLRMDVSKWDPPYRWWVDENYNLVCENRGTEVQRRTVYKNTTRAARVSGVSFTYPTTVKPLVILSDSNSQNSGAAIGVFLPQTGWINTASVRGYDISDGTIDYVDDRRIVVKAWDSPRRIPTMQLFGFEFHLLGLLNPARLETNIKEKFCGEVYILYGTPYQIYINAQRICPF